MDEFARSAGGRTAVRELCERARDAGEEPLASLVQIYTERTGQPQETLVARFGARLYAAVETEPGPSAVGLWDLEAGAFDAGVPAPWTVRHRSYLPADGSAAIRYSWPAGAGAGAAVVRYRDSDLPPDVVFLEPDHVQSIALSGVARVDWVVAGGSSPAGPVDPVFFEATSGYPFAGLQPHAMPLPEGPRLWWTTASHGGLTGWAVFREEVQADGRIVRSGPQIVPASSDTRESLRYAYLDTGVRAGHVLPLHGLGRHGRRPPDAGLLGDPADTGVSFSRAAGDGGDGPRGDPSMRGTKKIRREPDVGRIIDRTIVRLWDTIEELEALNPAELHFYRVAVFGSARLVSHRPRVQRRARSSPRG